MDRRGAWWAAVLGVKKSRTQLSTHKHIITAAIFSPFSCSTVFAHWNSCIVSKIRTWLPMWRRGKESACQYKRPRRLRFDPWVGKKMATHSSILAWKIPWKEEKPGALQSMGSQRIEHSWVCTHTHFIITIPSLFSCTVWNIRTCQYNNIIMCVHRMHIFSHDFSPPN